MVSPGEVIGLIVLVGINTAIAAVATRFFRLVLTTRLGSAIYIVIFVPILLVISTLILSGVLNLGFDLQDRYIAWLVAIFVPFAIGLTLDFVWVASPDEVREELTP